MCGEALGVKNWTAAIIIYAITAVASVVGIYLYKRMSDKAKLRAEQEEGQAGEENPEGQVGEE
jgi:membrane protein implicated in regulation of membrane protease activity